MKKIFIFFLLMFIPAIALCSTSIVSDKDTGLHPQGWLAGGALKFKQGSQVELNERGEVISGVLKFNEYLRSAGKGFSKGYDTSKTLYFKGDESITFDEHGFVISGTLAGIYNYIYLMPNTEPLVTFKGGKTILFDKNGNVVYVNLKVYQLGPKC